MMPGNRGKERLGVKDNYETDGRRSRDHIWGTHSLRAGRTDVNPSNARRRATNEEEKENQAVSHPGRLLNKETPI